MQCEEVRIALSTGEGNEAIRVRIDGHLGGCAGCREFAAFLRQLERGLAELAGDPAEAPPPALAGRIRGALLAGTPVSGVAPADPEPAGIGAHGKGKRHMPRILAVDDEPNIVRLIQVNLQRLGYDVEIANNGAQALEKIRANRPDLVVSDVMMPEMDGFELVKQLRMDPTYADLPVIMLTAKAQDRDVMEGYSRGADMYLTKPFNPAELIQFVNRVLASVNEDDSGAYRI